MFPFTFVNEKWNVGTRRKQMPHRKSVDHFVGCLFGGAVGDALGAAIEFLPLDRIRKEFGDAGLTGYAPAYGRKGAVTDDSQMTLFTAEGLILSKVRPEYSSAGDDGITTAVYHALLRWLYTQEPCRQKSLISSFGTCSIVDGVLTGHKELFFRRAPGNTCLSALRSGRMGTIQAPINDSKGCGGVMRAAPVGLFFSDAEKAFRMGCECAAITHGHPTGYLVSGVMAAVISMLASGESLQNAVSASIQMLRKRPAHLECLLALERAVEYSGRCDLSPEAIEKLGAGWVAEEALAISLCCALAAPNNYKKAVLAAVNHSGDSDSTGSITGNIVGLLNGKSTIPSEWIEELELKKLIAETAEDLVQHAV